MNEQYNNQTEAPGDAAEAATPVEAAVAPNHFQTLLVRKLAREMNVDPAQVPGSGRGGRVTKADILRAEVGVAGPLSARGAVVAQPIGSVSKQVKIGRSWWATDGQPGVDVSAVSLLAEVVSRAFGSGSPGLPTPATLRCEFVPAIGKALVETVPVSAQSGGEGSPAAGEMVVRVLGAGGPDAEVFAPEEGVLALSIGAPRWVPIAPSPDALAIVPAATLVLSHLGQSADEVAQLCARLAESFERLGGNCS